MKKEAFHFQRINHCKARGAQKQVKIQELVTRILTIISEKENSTSISLSIKFHASLYCLIREMGQYLLISKIQITEKVIFGNLNALESMSTQF
jgi:hypothetical protein